MGLQFEPYVPFGAKTVQCYALQKTQQKPLRFQPHGLKRQHAFPLMATSLVTTPVLCIGALHMALKYGQFSPAIIRLPEARTIWSVITTKVEHSSPGAILADPYWRIFQNLGAILRQF